MEDINRTRYLIKAKTILFCNRIDSELTKPNRKFLQEMIYGMVSRKSVLLTEIARKLRTSTSFKKVHERLRLNLKKDGWSNILEDNLIVENDRRVDKETVVALDISDLSKKNATKMEHICKVRDGSQSSSSKTKTGLGYWLFEAVGINRSKAEKFPLLGWLYSSESSDFISENNVVLKGFRKLKEAFGDRGIYAFDRGGDRGKIIKPLLEENFRLVIRMIGTKHIRISIYK